MATTIVVLAPPHRNFNKCFPKLPPNVHWDPSNHYKLPRDVYGRHHADLKKKIRKVF